MFFFLVQSHSLTQLKDLGWPAWLSQWWFFLDEDKTLLGCPWK